MALIVVIPFLVVVSVFVVVGMAAVQHSVSNAYTQWLLRASALGAFLLGPAASLAVKLTRWVTHSIGAQAAPLLRMGETWLSGIAQWAYVIFENALL